MSHIVNAPLLCQNTLWLCSKCHCGLCLHLWKCFHKSSLLGSRNILFSNRIQMFYRWLILKIKLLSHFHLPLHFISILQFNHLLLSILTNNKISFYTQTLYFHANLSNSRVWYNYQEVFCTKNEYFHQCFLYFVTYVFLSCQILLNV